MIIVEGPDGAGKSTLVKEILHKYPEFKEGERGTTDRSKLYTVTVEDTFRAIDLALRARKQLSLRVWDRLFFSERIYYSLTGRENQFSPGQEVFIGHVLEAMRCPIFLCLPPYEAVYENAQVHKQMQGVTEHLEEIYIGYSTMYWDMPNQTMLYDYTQTNREAIWDIRSVFAVIDNYLEEREHRLW